MSDESNANVTYTVKEMLSMMDTKLDTKLSALDTKLEVVLNRLEDKADRAKVHDLTTIVATKASIVDVQKLGEDLSRIKQDGTIGTREALQDHEIRLRFLEKFRFAVPSVAALSALAAIGLFISTLFHL